MPHRLEIEADLLARVNSTPCCPMWREGRSKLGKATSWE
jgi:hypothetical protein